VEVSEDHNAAAKQRLVLNLFEGVAKAIPREPSCDQVLSDLRADSITNL